MFIVLLEFSDNKARAGELMTAHNDWIQAGFDDGVFLLVGSLGDGAGGAILARETSSEALRARVDRDPFVTEGVVTASLLEVTPGRTDDRLAFLLD